MRPRVRALATALLFAMSACDCAGTGAGRGGDAAFTTHPIEGPPAIVPQPVFAWPVDAPEQISSTFGPRWKSSDGRDDFHRGIDFYDARGAPLRAIGSGIVDGVYPDGSPNFPNSGNTVIVEHPLPPGSALHGTALTRVYAVYFHLQTIEVSVDQAVESGDLVGTMGDTGDTDFVHLHFEMRVETRCSLAFGTSNPDSSCALGFDPHVHPFLFLRDAPNDDEITLRRIDATTFEVRGGRGDLDLDVIESDRGVLGFGTREGFDATSNARLDDFERGFVTLSPGEFVSASAEWSYTLEFARAPAFVEVRDVYGRGLRWGD